MAEALPTHLPHVRPAQRRGLARWGCGTALAPRRRPPGAGGRGAGAGGAARGRARAAPPRVGTKAARRGGACGGPPRRARRPRPVPTPPPPRRDRWARRSNPGKHPRAGSASAADAGVASQWAADPGPRYRLVGASAIPGGRGGVLHRRDVVINFAIAPAARPALVLALWWYDR